MNYSGIYYSDMGNGPGWRVTLFVSGCSNKCPGCQNLEAQDYNYGKLYNEDLHNKIIESLKRPQIQGLSLSGGDPLWQNSDGLKSLIKLCQEAHELNKNVWLWTGFVWEDIFSSILDRTEVEEMRKLLKNCDVVVDGPFILEKRDITLAHRGSSNQRIIDVKKTLENGEVVLWKA